MRKPIITTDVPGCDHLVDKNNPNGFLIRPKSSENIKNSVLKILNCDLKNGKKQLQLLPKEFLKK